MSPPALHTPFDAAPRVTGRATAELSSPADSQPEIHRVDPESGSTLRLTDRDFQSNCWVNLRILGQPCEFYLRAQVRLTSGIDRRVKRVAQRTRVYTPQFEPPSKPYFRNALHRFSSSMRLSGRQLRTRTRLLLNNVRCSDCAPSKKFQNVP